MDIENFGTSLYIIATTYARPDFFIFQFCVIFWLHHSNKKPNNDLLF